MGVVHADYEMEECHKDKNDSTPIQLEVHESTENNTARQDKCNYTKVRDEVDSEDMEELSDVTETEQESQLTNTALEGMPIDRGWAWIILIGCVLYAAIAGGLNRSYGVFFLEFQQRFSAKAADVAFMSFIQNIIVSLTGLLVMTVGLKKLSCRTVVAIGGVLYVLAHIISGFAQDIRVFYFSHGLLGGAGIALVVPPMLAMIGVYFKKHRGLATSIFTGSASVGGFILAPVITKLFEEYGYTGALVIVAGLLSNSIVSAALLRPPAWFQNQHKSSRAQLEDDTRASLIKQSKFTMEPEFDQSKFTQELLIDPSKSTKVSLMKESKFVNEPIMDQPKFANGHRFPPDDDKLDDGQVENSVYETQQPGLCNTRQKLSAITRNSFLQRANSYHPEFQTYPLSIRVRSWSHGNKDTTLRKKTGNSYSSPINALKTPDVSHGTLYISTEGLCGSVINFQKPINIDKENETKSISAKQGNCCLFLKSGAVEILSTNFDCKLLRSVVFVQFLIMAFVSISGMLFVSLLIPPYAKDKGIQYSQIAVIISVMACLDLTSKILIGVIADRKWIKRTTILGVAAVVNGTLCHLARLFTNFPLILTMAIFMSCVYGLYQSMYPTILIDCIGLERFQSSLGFVTLVHGISIAVFFPISGLLRDTYGSYIYSLHMCGGLCYIGAILLFLLPTVQKKVKEKDEAVRNTTV